MHWLKSTLFALACAVGVLTASPAGAQGCGSTNPNCVVPTPPISDNSSRAVNSSWVNSWIASSSVVRGPGSSTVGHIATFNNTTGTLLADAPVPCASLSNAAASCSTDTTNAANITSNQIATARGGTGANTSVNSAGQILGSNGTNGSWVPTTVNALCTFAPTSCARVAGFVNIAWYGAVCDGATNDLTAIQNAWNAAAALNLDVWLGSASGVSVSCNIGTGTLTMPTPVALPSSSSAFARASMLRGPGSALVRLISTGTGTNCAIQLSATYGVNSSLGGVFGGFGIFQGNTNQTARGLCLNNITFLNIDDFATSFFLQGILAIDCIIININRSWIEFNGNGISAQYGTTTPPNAWNVTNSTFVSQKQYSIFVSGAPTAGAKIFNIIGNNFQSDGATPGFCSIFNQYDGTPYGGTGLNVLNNYFEGNGGCEITFTQAASTNLIGVHNVTGNYFVRSLTALTAGIVINNNGSGTAKTTVNVSGNAFSDVLLTGASYQWLSFAAPSTFNAGFICQGNIANVPAEINSRCGAVAATKTMTSDANAQWVGFN